MSDLVSEFLAREQENFRGIDDFKFDDFSHTTLNNQVYYQCEDDEVNESDNQDLNSFINDDECAIECADFNAHCNVLTKMEPEKIRTWRIEFDARLAAKDAEEAHNRLLLEREAKVYLDDYNTLSNEQLIKKRIMNRESESAFVEERDVPVAGSEWQRVCGMCDFGVARPLAASSALVPATGVKGAVAVTNNGAQAPLVTVKDTSRMRSILLSLKNEPLIRASISP